MVTGKPAEFPATQPPFRAPAGVLQYLVIKGAPIAGNQRLIHQQNQCDSLCRLEEGKFVMSHSARILTVALLLAFSGAALAAESTPERCTLVVRNCISPDHATVVNARAYDGDDGQHMVPASDHGPFGLGEQVELFCYHPNCDTFIQTYRTGTIIGYPVHVWDACRDITVRWDIIRRAPEWSYDLSNC